MKNTHKHKCPNPKCAAIWEHPDSCMWESSQAEHEKLHSCPSCGAEQYYKYGGLFADLEGDDPAMFRQDCHAHVARVL